MKEAEISISGVTLTEGQSMTVRVAIQTFGMTLQDDGLGSDRHGKAMAKGYLDRIAEINALIAKTAK